MTSLALHRPRKATLAAIVTMLLVAQGCGPGYPQAPDISLRSIDGTEFSLNAHRGQVVVLNFWATWCGPCIAEMPELEALHEAYAATGLTVVGVSIDEDSADVVRQFVDGMDITYQIVHDTGVAQAAFGGLHAVPTTVIVDRRGRTRQIIVGVFDPDLLRLEVTNLL